VIVRSRVDAWVDDYARTSEDNRRKLAKLRIAVAAMREAGIECLVLKGADVIPRVYGVFGVRRLGDADLLVHERDLAALERVVSALGYRRQIDGNAVYVDADDILALDVITSIWYVDDPAAIWRRAMSRALDGVPIKAMDPSDLVVYLTAYSVLHRGHLSHAYAQDIVRLVEHERIDWDVVVDEAARGHLRAALHHGLAYVVTTNPGARIPPDVVDRLAPATLGERLWSRALERLVTDVPVPELGHLLLFASRPGVDKLRWLHAVFLPSARFLGYRYGDAADAHPWGTRLVRGAMLVVRGHLLLARVVARLVRR
jgi:hypothetical protein